MTEVRHTVDVTELLRDSRSEQFNFKWPLAIDQRLDDLVARANDVGANTSRKELLAALLLACDSSGDDLSERTRIYRTSRVAAALLDHPAADGNVVEFPQRRPGRRSSKA